jgi:hypothetical protein
MNDSLVGDGVHRIEQEELGNRTYYEVLLHWYHITKIGHSVSNGNS